MALAKNTSTAQTPTTSSGLASDPSFQSWVRSEKFSTDYHDVSYQLEYAQKYGA